MLPDKKLFPPNTPVHSRKRGISGVVDAKHSYNVAFVYVWWGTYLTEEYIGDLEVETPLEMLARAFRRV